MTTRRGSAINSACLRRKNDMRMVLYAETFLAITAFVYMSMVCLMNAEIHDTAVLAQPVSPAGEVAT